MWLVGTMLYRSRICPLPWKILLGNSGLDWKCQVAESRSKMAQSQEVGTQGSPSPLISLFPEPLLQVDIYTVSAMLDTDHLGNPQLATYCPSDDCPHTPPMVKF